MKTLLFFVSLISGSAAFAQKAISKLSFINGQSLEVVTNATISAKSMMGATSGTIITADAYKVSRTAANTTTLLKEPKKLKMNFTFGSQQINLDSENPRDLEGPFGQPVKEIMNQKPEFTIDETGTVIAVKKTEKVKKEEQQPGAGVMGMMMPGMDLASALPQVGNASFFKVLPNREIGIDDTWTDSLSNEGNTNITIYKVKEITDKEVIVDFTGEGTTKSEKEAMGMNVNINASHHASGSIVLDKATGIIKQKTTVNTTESTMNLGGREITSTIKSTLLTTVKSS